MYKWLIALIFVVLGEAIGTSLIPLSQKYFYDALAQYSTGAFLFLIFYFLARFSYDISQAIKNYFVVRLSLIYRDVKTQQLVNIGKLQQFNSIKNIPQRLQEDIKLMYYNTITVYAEYAISSIIFLWLIVQNYDQPYLIISAIIYALISLCIAYLFNPKMIEAEQIVQRSEADFREYLSDIISMRGFVTALKCNIRASKIRLWFQVFTKFQGGFVLLLPFLVLVPQYLDQTITLGDMISKATLFGLIVVNMDIMIMMFPLLTQANASKKRVQDLTS